MDTTTEDIENIKAARSHCIVECNEARAKFEAATTAKARIFHEEDLHFWQGKVANYDARLRSLGVSTR